jgi:uncharacterized protein YlxP (DUF503 family)
LANLLAKVKSLKAKRETEKEKFRSLEDRFNECSAKLEEKDSEEVGDVIKKDEEIKSY